MTGLFRVLRSTDPEAARLQAAGWTVVGESWGARLRLTEPPDLGAPRAAVTAARARGYDVRELDRTELPAVVRLEALTAPDYPWTPATAAPEVTEQRLDARGARCFGCLLAGELHAVSVVIVGFDRVETDFTSVHPAHRRRGLAVAVKGASLCALAAEGHRLFGTGGAALNAASLAMNIRLGYVVEERWLSLGAPPHRRQPG